MILNHGGRTVVDPSTPKPKIVDLKIIIGNGIEKMVKYSISRWPSAVVENSTKDPEIKCSKQPLVLG
jgi:hypothetical protein